MVRDINKMLIGAAVRKTLKNINKSPEREIRNLVDLGLEFSGGGFQKSFLQNVREAVDSPDSAYYSLVKNVLNSVDNDILTSFGMNFGYNGCTKGVKQIKRLEAERGFLIPWTLSFGLNEERLADGVYQKIIKRCKEFGIHVFTLFFDGDPIKTIELIEDNPDCAFTLFVRGERVSGEFIERAQSVKNVVISVFDDENMASACKKLRRAKLFYSVHFKYAENDVQNILNGEKLGRALSVKAPLFILIADGAVPLNVQNEVYDYVLSVRQGCESPLVLMDLKNDIIKADKAVSGGGRLTGFDGNGFACTYDGIDSRYNIFECDFEKILANIYNEKKGDSNGEG